MADVDRIAAALRYQQEMDAAQRPATMNPNIAAQGEVSRNRIAAALANQPPSWSGESLPMEGRATFLPFRDTIPGSVMNKRELALPGMVAGAVNAFTAPARSMQSFVDEDGNVTSNFNAPEEAVNVAMNMMGGGIGTSRVAPIPNGSLGMNVYHGTPHRFPPTAKNPLGEFDATKIGTGEGAQAYGHGLYLAEAKKVAAGYKKDLSNFEQPFIQSGKTKVAGQDMSNLYLEMFKYLETGKKHAGQFPHNTLYYAKEAAANKPEVLAKLNTLDHDVKFGHEINKGHLYRVDLPDDQIAKMLDWDKPLSQQPKAVQKALAGIDKDMYHPKGSDYDPSELGQQTYQRLIRMFGDGKTSAVLAGKGIPGIRYLDEGSRGASTGTRNFVVFPGNEGLLNILGRE